jgi:tol-pal system protein YbgF
MAHLLRLVTVLLLLAQPLRAQEADPQTLADIRTELTALYAQVQELRTLFSTSGADTGVANAGPALQRLDVIETELRRVTGELERVENRVQQVVDDGTRRVGDLEFRLTELEGGDTSALGDTPTLGGEAVAVAPVVESPLEPVVVVPPAGGEQPELAASEQFDYDAAFADFNAGNFGQAADKFAAFVTTYPGSPLSSDAQFYRAEALASQGDWGHAARSYLDSFSGAPSGPHAPVALYKLGVALAELGQLEEACLTLNEVQARYPAAEPRLLEQVLTTKQDLGCL